MGWFRSVVVVVLVLSVWVSACGSGGDSERSRRIESVDVLVDEIGCTDFESQDPGDQTLGAAPIEAGSCSLRGADAEILRYADSTGVNNRLTELETVCGGIVSEIPVVIGENFTLAIASAEIAEETQQAMPGTEYRLVSC